LQSGSDQKPNLFIAYFFTDVSVISWQENEEQIRICNDYTLRP